MAIPNFLQTYFASYELSSLDIKRDKDLIITEILNKGDEKAVRWLGGNYTAKDIKSVVSKPTRGMWLESTLNYWLKILSINLPPEIKKKAIINLNP